MTVFIGTASKFAAFALAMRLLPEALAASQPDWSQMLVVLAVLSMAIGNVVAIAQTNLKRMLAYSTISHIGYILLGILVGHRAGLPGGDVLHDQLRARGERRLRHDPAARAPGLRGRQARGLQGPERAQPLVRRHDGDV